MTARAYRAAGAILLCAVFTGGCRDPDAGSREPDDGSLLERQGDEISVCGQLFHSGTRVVLWNDAGGYDAYRSHRHFKPEEAGPSHAPERIARYGSFRRNLPAELAERVRKEGWVVDDLREVVSQVVIHFDACGTSRRCFEVLHDIRGLSCHFLLDLDGTIYQTLDLKERAWHAGVANDRSIGIEIAHLGAVDNVEQLAEWYAEDETGRFRMTMSEGSDSGLPASFVARPARPGVFDGKVNGRELVQRDFTAEQYAALEKLLAALSEIFPRVRADYPRGDDGRVRDRVFASEDELHAFEGWIGHWHVTDRKVDPGPAFDWERVRQAVTR